jgi:hypothetical protein
MNLAVLAREFSTFPKYGSDAHFELNVRSQFYLAGNLNLNVDFKKTSRSQKIVFTSSLR